MRKVSPKRLREMLYAVKVHNDHELFKVVSPTPPLISYITADKWRSPKWRVWRIGLKVNPNSHWQDGGAMAFIVSRYGDETPGQAKNRALTEAVAWTSKRYGYTTDEWEKTPFGAWAPKNALEVALSHHLPEHFGQVVYVPPTERPDTRPLNEVVKRVPIESVGDPVVKRITDKLYTEDPEWVESTPKVDTRERLVGGTSEAIRKAFDTLEDESRADESPKVEISSFDADGWYRVVGAGVAVFVQATDAANARGRVEHMIKRMSMDASLELHITRRDSEVN